MINHDRLFKQLISTFFLEFIDLFLPEVRAYIEDGSLVFLDKEIFSDMASGDRREVDLVAKLRFKGQPAFFLVHVETQNKAQTTFGKRMFAYFAGLHAKHDLPVYPIALLTFDTPPSPQPDSYQVTFPDRTVLDFRYRVIQLNQLSWRRFAREENPVASALMAKMAIAPEDRVRVRLECVRLLATLRLNKAKTQVILEFLDTYLRLNEPETEAYQVELEKFSPVEKEKMMSVTIVWKEEGRQQGIQEGIQQGIQQGMLSVILPLLERRLGAIDAETRARIGVLSPDQLKTLGGALMDFNEVGDLTKWLDEV